MIAHGRLFEIESTFVGFDTTSFSSFKPTGNIVKLFTERKDQESS